MKNNNNIRKIEVYTFCDKILLNKFEEINFNIEMQIFKNNIKNEIRKIIKKLKNKNDLIINCFFQNENLTNNCYFGKNNKYHFYLFSFFEILKENNNFYKVIFKNMNNEFLDQIDLDHFYFFFIEQIEPKEFSCFKNEWDQINIDKPLHDYDFDCWLKIIQSLKNKKSLINNKDIGK